MVDAAKHREASYRWYHADLERGRATARRANARRHAQRRQLLDQAKDVPCLDCGGRFPPECMDFDHVMGDKRFNIGAAMSEATASVLEEIAKCEIVCANCHRIRTKVRRAKA